MEKKDMISLILSVTLFISFWLGFHGYGQTIYGVGLSVLSIRLAYLEIKYQSKYPPEVIMAYCWLLVAGLSSLLSDHILYSYDLVLHAFFLGFFFSMIFINAPDALLEKLELNRLNTYPNFWVLLLSLGLIVRLIVGDLFHVQEARNLGGTLNLLTIILYMAYLLFQMITKDLITKSTDG